MFGEDLRTIDHPGAGAAGTGDGGATGHRRKTGAGLARANLLLAGMCVAGALCVYLLAVRSGPSRAAAVQTGIESDVAGALSNLSSTAEARKLAAAKDRAVMEAFALEARHRQVPRSDLRGNPFAYVPLPSAAPPAPIASAAQPATVTPGAEARQYADALAEAKKLHLQSVLMGAQAPMAMISNNLLREGQDIGGWTVLRIQPKEVVLGWQGKQYILTLP